MGTEERDTLVERWVRRAKNQPLLAVLIFVGIGVGGVSSLGETIAKLYHWFVPEAVAISPLSAPTKPDLSVMGAELQDLEESTARNRLEVQSWDISLSEDEARLEQLHQRYSASGDRREVNRLADSLNTLQDRIGTGKKVRDKLRASIGLAEARIATLRNRIAENR